jgi:TonB family protein
VEPPKFELIAAGDTPVFEGAAELLHTERGGYLPEPESCSILDATPKPEKPDYTVWIAAVAIALLLAVALRVVTYYAAGRAAPDNTPLEARAHIVPLTPLPSADAQQVDDTIYYPAPGVTLPVLQSKSEPQANAEGKVILLAVIDPSGKPVGARVSRGLDPDLNVRALEAAAKWRFRPGTKDGRPVPVIAQLEVNFRPL